MKKAKIIEKRFTFFNDLVPRLNTSRIVIHHTGGADIDAYAEQIHTWHLEKGYAGIGYHFVIRKNGDIERGRPLWTVGAHAYGANSDSIGIHLSGDFTYNAPSKEQIESAALLIANLCEQYSIPFDRRHILGHREVDPAGLSGTSCPGNMLFNMLDVIVSKANWYRFNNADTVDTPAEPPKIIWKPRAGMLSEHFAESEFACECCGKCEMDPRLIELLEQLRYNIGGYPLYILEGYRCAQNAEGIDDLHCTGKAATVACPRQLTFGQFKWYVENLPFDGIEYYSNFADVDVCNGGIGSKR